MNGQVKVTRMVETVRAAEGGRLERVIEVHYMVGEHGPFIHHFPREGFSGSLARVELEQAAREYEQLARG